MAEQLKIVIDADVSGAISGVNQFRKSVDGLTTGSIAQLQKGAMLLRTQLANLSPGALKSDFGKQLTASLATVNSELKILQKEAGIAGQSTQSAFQTAYSSVRQLANILPGIGISGLIGLATTAIIELASSLFDSGKTAEETKLEYDRLSEAIKQVKINTDDLIASVKEGNKLGAINVEIRGQGPIQGLREQSVANRQLIADLAQESQKALKLNQQANAKVVEDASKENIKLADDALIALRDAQKKEADAREEQIIIFRSIESQRLKDLKKSTEDQKRVTDKFIEDAIARARAFEKEFPNLFIVPDLEISFTNTKEKVAKAAFKLLDDIDKGLLQLKLVGPRQVNIPIELDLTVANNLQKTRDDLFKNANIFGDKTKIIKGVVPGVSDDIAKRNKAFFDDFQQDILATAGLVTDVLSPAFNDMFDAIAANQNPLKAFFHGLEQSVNQLIKKLIQAAIEAAILSALSGGTSSFGGIFSSLLGFAGGGRANFNGAGLGGAIGGQAFNNVIQITGGARIAGNDIVLSYSRTTNSNGRF